MSKEITQVTHIKTKLEGPRYPGFNQQKETAKQNGKYIERELPFLLLERLKTHKGLNIDDLSIEITEEQLGKALEVLVQDNHIVDYERVDDGYEVVRNQNKYPN